MMMILCGTDDDHAAVVQRGHWPTTPQTAKRPTQKYIATLLKNCTMRAQTQSGAAFSCSVRTESDIPDIGQRSGAVLTNVGENKEDSPANDNPALRSSFSLSSCPRFPLFSRQKKKNRASSRSGLLQKQHNFPLSDLDNVAHFRDVIMPSSCCRCELILRASFLSFLGLQIRPRQQQQQPLLPCRWPRFPRVLLRQRRCKSCCCCRRRDQTFVKERRRSPSVGFCRRRTKKRFSFWWLRRRRQTKCVNPGRHYIHMPPSLSLPPDLSSSVRVHVYQV